MSLHAQHSISSAFCMYGSELLGGLQPPEPPPLDPPLRHRCWSLVQPPSQSLLQVGSVLARHGEYEQRDYSVY